MYTYTKKGEERAKEISAERIARGESPLEERRAGSRAYFAGEPLEASGSIAAAWKRRGYVEEVILY